MKYLCMAFEEERILNALSKSDWETLRKETLDYVADLQRKGHLISAEPLQSVKTASTVRVRGSKISVTDGPFAEIKEQLGGIMILEAENLDQAIRLMSNHTSVRMGGSWEIRPANEAINALSETSKQSGIQP
jgi:hypothetical protein